MTKMDFVRQPLLMHERDVMQATDWSRATLRKMVDCGVLELVKPAGAGHGKYRKKQVAFLLGCPLAIDADELLQAFRAERLLMPQKAVMRFTGYDRKTLENIQNKGGLAMIRPAGIGQGKYRKTEVARLVGFEELV